MPLNNDRPITGRFRKAGFGFLSSTWGLPVAGSIGSRSPTIVPQIPPPHLLTRTRASPAWVSQIPVGSPAPCARADGAASNAAATAMMKALLQAMNHSPKKSGLHSNKSDLCNAGLHDPEKWKPVFRRDHAQT